MANARFSATFNDYNGEASTVSVRADLPLLNEVQMPLIETRFNSLLTAIGNVTLGVATKVSRTWKEENVAAPNSFAATADAQRERKWLVRYMDSEFHVGSFEIPTADLSLLEANSERMDISAGAGAALVAAIEDVVVSPYLLPITVVEIVHVGRNT
jgi:hypothetical protein